MSLILSIKVGGKPFALSVLMIKECWILSKAFSWSIERKKASSPLVSRRSMSDCSRSTLFAMLFLGMNPCWSWCMISLMKVLSRLVITLVYIL